MNETMWMDVLNRNYVWFSFVPLLAWAFVFIWIRYFVHFSIWNAVWIWNREPKTLSKLQIRVSINQKSFLVIIARQESPDICSIFVEYWGEYYLSIVHLQHFSHRRLRFEGTKIILKMAGIAVDLKCSMQKRLKMNNHSVFEQRKFQKCLVLIQRESLEITGRHFNSFRDWSMSPDSIENYYRINMKEELNLIL